MKARNDMNDWTCALELSEEREITGGSRTALRDAIRRGADLRIYTEFKHNEHIDTSSDSAELVSEVAEFRATYLVDDRWVAGIMTLRQPVDLPRGFGPRSSMSFFMYNEDGRQAIARLHLDGVPADGTPGPSSVMPEHDAMQKYHQLDSWDDDTNAPSHNFVYDFEVFRFWVRDAWQEVFSHTDDGTVVSGSVDDLVDAFKEGADVKVGIRGLSNDLAAESEKTLDHEMFIQTNSGYYYTEQKIFRGATHPFVRVKAAVPMEYASGGWDAGWALARSDGHVVLRLADPYTLRFRDTEGRYALRWFVR
jgi:hypothetical protein